MKNDNNENIKIFKENSPSPDNQDNEFKNKINELEKKIKELELKIKEKDAIIKAMELKNDNLTIKIKELQNISNNNLGINNIIELENENKLFRKYNNFSEGEKLISIKITSGEQDIDYSLIIKNTEKFLKLENIIYEKYPKYYETENYFLVGGKTIDKHKSLEQNNIKNNDVIMLLIYNSDSIIRLK